MRHITKFSLIAAAVLILSLAGYGAFALLTSDAEPGGRAAATNNVQIASPTPLEASDTKSGQHSLYDDMARLCAQHMKEMQPLMEKMMAEMMSDMMDEAMPNDMMPSGMMDGMMGDDMMDGMMDGDMMDGMMR